MIYQNGKIPSIALPLLLRYQDADNYYKLEADSQNWPCDAHPASQGQLGRLGGEQTGSTP
ncbi:MAG: hypothetical protein HC814_00305 [Rhodobacteraceae bacterium]|nr:hypothetical protein [Paracoccaceae bacterium]